MYVTASNAPTYTVIAPSFRPHSVPECATDAPKQPGHGIIKSAFGTLRTPESQK